MAVGASQNVDSSRHYSYYAGSGCYATYIAGLLLKRGCMCMEARAGKGRQRQAFSFGSGSYGQRSNSWHLDDATQHHLAHGRSVMSSFVAGEQGPCRRREYAIIHAQKCACSGCKY